MKKNSFSNNNISGNFLHLQILIQNVACHGANGEKVVLGKSKIIKDMTKEDFVASLKGYQDGTYGGAQKALMVGQVKGMDEATMNRLLI